MHPFYSLPELFIFIFVSHSRQVPAVFSSVGHVGVLAHNLLASKVDTQLDLCRAHIL